MIPIEIGMSLLKDGETTEIYNKFREYFELKEDRYFFIKEPSEELIHVIEDFFHNRFQKQEKREDGFVKKVALDIFNNLSQEEKNKIFEDPTLATEHFGFCFWIRAQYIHPVELDLGDYDPEWLSYKIGIRVASLILNYDYENEFYYHLYNNSNFCHYRKLYNAFYGEYPNSIIERYANLSDKNIASEKVVKKLKSILLDTNRFKRLSKKYGLTEKQYNECKKIIDNYNKKHWDIVPYDIVLLRSKKLEPEFRKKILKLMKTVFTTFEASKMVALELPIFVFNQKDAVLLAVGAFGSFLQRFSKFNSDDEVIKTALTRDGGAIKYVKKELRENLEYIRLAVACESSFNPLQLRFMYKYRDNEDIIRIAVEADGRNIEYASKKLRDNFEIAKLAIEHSPYNSVVKYLTPRLRDNIELALLEIRHGVCDVTNYSRRLRNSDEIAEALIYAGREHQLSDMSKRIRNSDKIAKIIISVGRTKYLIWMSDRIQKKYCKSE